MCIDSVGCTDSQISIRMYVVVGPVKLNLLPKPEAPKDQICRGLRIRMENSTEKIVMYGLMCTAYRKMPHM